MFLAFIFILINILINIDKQLYFLILNELKSNGKNIQNITKYFNVFNFQQILNFYKFNIINLYSRLYIIIHNRYI